MYPEEQLGYQEQEYNTEQTTNAPRRRRKKPQNRPSRWTEESVEAERPVRRRNLRRKRPTLDTWPRLSEFNDYRPQETTEVDKDRAEFEDPLRVDYNINDSSDNRDTFLQDEIHENDNERTKSVIPVQHFENDGIHLKEDKSLSEFSMEAHPDTPLKTEEAEIIREKLREKSPEIKAQDKARVSKVLILIDYLVLTICLEY